MGILDRNWYQDHWAEKFLGAKSKHKPFSDSTRGPIYVSDTGTASRSIDADPRLGAVDLPPSAVPVIRKESGLKVT